MTLLRRVNVVWTSLGGGSGLSSFWFHHQPGSAITAGSAVQKFFQDNATKMVAGVGGSVQAEQPIYESTTNKVVSIEDGGTQVALNGSDATQPLPFFTQGLLRLKTGVYVNGRRVQGHIFIPGPSENVSDQAPISTYISAWNASAATLKTSAAAFGAWEVYSRTHLVEAEVVTATMWNKWAVLRSRR